MAERIIFHIDVNSAFLSWTAAYRVRVLGESLDLRTVPSVIAGDRESRHSIILAKSGPAKKYGIKTAEPLGKARDKCPGLLVAEPDYDLYTTASRSLIALLRRVSPAVEQYSIDEAWVDMTGMKELLGPPVLAAEQLKNRIRDELGFTVNIGISSNKLLAKMAGDFEKPDKVHTLFPWELEQKLWPLPTQELFFVGRATAEKLSRMGIETVGQLARADPGFLQKKLHKQGLVVWQYANGRDAGMLTPETPANKGYGNSFTTPTDVTKRDYACQVLLSLCETVGMRLRRDEQAGSCVTVHIRSCLFEQWSRQRQLGTATNGTDELYRAACAIFDELWDGVTPLRQLGVQVTKLTSGTCRQCSLFDVRDYGRLQKLDGAVDAIRDKYGEGAILRATFLKSPVVSMAGGLAKSRRTGITKPVLEPESLLVRRGKAGVDNEKGPAYDGNGTKSGVRSCQIGTEKRENEF
jgi:DNA polymerase-4